ncbi:cell division protein FtsB [Mariprofundus micogutta]|uniref:Cell division protein FtsB n=1 Tax=Mariprofundus micogutta TaxID=1921010 RepID=A0A1L8CQK2_9PROT|nr:septum formation initiator family protein [Mariprofundus micogutta]GAV21198.1 cell division protein FtsB [Mariprofundus micogutta]
MVRSIGRWLYWALGGALLAYMCWNLIFSDHGYLVYREEAVQLQALKAELVTLKADRERLAQEILRLRDDPKALEELIHRELGYVYPDEFMVIMPENKLDKGKSE